MRRLRDTVRSRIRPGGRGSPSGPTTWLCLQWLDADRMKAAKASRIGGGNARPVPEARSPGHKSPRMERREATRFLFAEEAKHHPLRPAALHAPRWGDRKMITPAERAGANAHA